MKFYWLSLFVVFSSAVFGRAVSESEARAAVDKWILQTRLMDGRTVSSIETLSTTEVTDAFYLVHLSPSGYILMNRDTRLEPIVNFSESNSAFMIEPEARKIEDAVRNGIAKENETILGSAVSSVSVVENEARWSALLRSGGLSVQAVDNEVVVGPLLKTTWSQLQPYNLFTPGANNDNIGGYVVGCAATMSSQIFTYWQWPLHGRGSYQNTKDGNCLNYFSADYDWETRKAYEGSPSIRSDREALIAARISYDQGVLANMQYMSGGSAAWVQVPYQNGGPLLGYSTWGTDMNLVHTPTSDYNSFKATIIRELSAKRPMPTAVNTYVGAHAVVIDGYRESGSEFYISMNYGWGELSGWWVARTSPITVPLASCFAYMGAQFYPFPKVSSADDTVAWHVSPVYSSKPDYAQRVIVQAETFTNYTAVASDVRSFSLTGLTGEVRIGVSQSTDGGQNWGSPSEWIRTTIEPARPASISTVHHFYRNELKSLVDFDLNVATAENFQRQTDGRMTQITTLTNASYTTEFVSAAVGDVFSATVASRALGLVIQGFLVTQTGEEIPLESYFVNRETTQKYGFEVPDAISGGIVKFAVKFSFPELPETQNSNPYVTLNSVSLNKNMLASPGEPRSAAQNLGLPYMLPLQSQNTYVLPEGYDYSAKISPKNFEAVVTGNSLRIKRNGAAYRGALLYLTATNNESAVEYAVGLWPQRTFNWQTNWVETVTAAQNNDRMIFAYRGPSQPTLTEMQKASTLGAFVPYYETAENVQIDVFQIPFADKPDRTFSTFAQAMAYVTATAQQKGGHPVLPAGETFREVKTSFRADNSWVIAKDAIMPTSGIFDNLLVKTGGIIDARIDGNNIIRVKGKMIFEPGAILSFSAWDTRKTFTLLKSDEPIIADSVPIVTDDRAFPFEGYTAYKACFNADKTELYVTRENATPPTNPVDSLYWLDSLSGNWADANWALGSATNSFVAGLDTVIDVAKNCVIDIDAALIQTKTLTLSVTSGNTLALRGNGTLEASSVNVAGGGILDLNTDVKTEELTVSNAGSLSISKPISLENLVATEGSTLVFSGNPITVKNISGVFSLELQSDFFANIDDAAFYPILYGTDDVSLFQPFNRDGWSILPFRGMIVLAKKQPVQEMQAISLNVAGLNSSGALATSTVAGVHEVPASGWTQISAPSISGLRPVFADGSPAYGIGVDVAASGISSMNNASKTIFNSYLDSQVYAENHIKIYGLATNQTYTLYVYMSNSDAAGTFSAPKINGVSYTYNARTRAGATIWGTAKSVQSAEPGNVEGENYIAIKRLHGPDIEIFGLARILSTYGSIAAVQVVPDGIPLGTPETDRMIWAASSENAAWDGQNWLGYEASSTKINFDGGYPTTVAVTQDTNLTLGKSVTTDTLSLSASAGKSLNLTGFASLSATDLTISGKVSFGFPVEAKTLTATSDAELFFSGYPMTIKSAASKLINGNLTLTLKPEIKAILDTQLSYTVLSGVTNINAVTFIDDTWRLAVEENSMVLVATDTPKKPSYPISVNFGALNDQAHGAVSVKNWNKVTATSAVISNLTDSVGAVVPNITFSSSCVNLYGNNNGANIYNYYYDDTNPGLQISFGNLSEEQKYSLYIYAGSQDNNTAFAPPFVYVMKSDGSTTTNRYSGISGKTEIVTTARGWGHSSIYRNFGRNQEGGNYLVISDIQGTNVVVKNSRSGGRGSVSAVQLVPERNLPEPTALKWNNAITTGHWTNPNWLRPNGWELEKYRENLPVSFEISKNEEIAVTDPVTPESITMEINAGATLTLTGGGSITAKSLTLTGGTLDCGNVGMTLETLTCAENAKIVYRGKQLEIANALTNPVTLSIPDSITETFAEGQIYPLVNNTDDISMVNVICSNPAWRVFAYKNRIVLAMEQPVAVFKPISINIGTVSGETTYGAYPVAGKFWNNFDGQNWTDKPLNFSDGTSADPDMLFSSSGSNVYQGGDNIFYKYIDDGGNGAKMQIKGLNPEVTYTLFVYAATDQNSTTFSPMRITTSSNGILVSSSLYTANVDGKTVRTDSTNDAWGDTSLTKAPAVPQEGKNFLKIKGLRGDTVNVEGGLTAWPGRGGIGAIQIVPETYIEPDPTPVEERFGLKFIIR